MRVSAVALFSPLIKTKTIMKKQFLFLLAGGMIAFASCNSNTESGNNQKTDSTVNAKVDSIQNQMSANNDAAINAAAQKKADSIVAAQNATAQPAPATAQAPAQTTTHSTSRSTTHGGNGTTKTTTTTSTTTTTPPNSTITKEQQKEQQNKFNER